MANTRGPYGMYVVDDQTPPNQWFQREYRKAYGSPLSQHRPYQYAQGFLAAKYAYDEAAKAAGKASSTDRVIAALRGDLPDICWQRQDGPVQGSSGHHRRPLGRNCLGRKRGEVVSKTLSCSRLSA